MKNLIKVIASILVLNAITAYANTRDHVSLEQDHYAISTIKEGRVMKQEPLCPEGDFNCFVDGTRVWIEVPLDGCLDQLGTYAYSTEQKGNMLIVRLSATNIHDKGSLAAFCIKQPTAIIDLQLINQYGLVALEFLQ